MSSPRRIRSNTWPTSSCRCAAASASPLPAPAAEGRHAGRGCLAAAPATRPERKNSTCRCSMPSRFTPVPKALSAATPSGFRPKLSSMRVQAGKQFAVFVGPRNHVAVHNEILRAVRRRGRRVVRGVSAFLVRHHRGIRVGLGQLGRGLDPVLLPRRVGLAEPSQHLAKLLLPFLRVGQLGRQLPRLVLAPHSVASAASVASASLSNCPTWVSNSFRAASTLSAVQVWKRLASAFTRVPSKASSTSLINPIVIASRLSRLNNCFNGPLNFVRNVQRVVWSIVRPSANHMKSMLWPQAYSNCRLRSGCAASLHRG